MKRSEYRKYEEAVAAFLKFEGLRDLVVVNGNRQFSYRACRCCNRPEGGDRVIAGGITTEGEIYRYLGDELPVEFSICVDCEYYMAYGKLDDMTMMDMEEDEDVKSG